jgi:GNAT superfamily N-acetyltransferase
MSKLGTLRRLGELSEDWDHLIHHLGFFSAIPKVGLELWQLPYRHIKYLVFEKPLTDPSPDFRPEISMEIRPFSFSDLESARRINRPSEINLCARRLAAGHMGLVALHSGRMAAYAWGCGEVDPRIETVCPKLISGDVLCVDAFTSQEFRNKGVQTSLTLARFRLFRERGFLRAVSTVDIRNYPSRAVWKKLGARVVNILDFQRIGIWRRTRYL